FTDDEGSTSQKRQSDESLYGWRHTYVAPVTINEPVDPILERTLRLKQNYLLDSKYAKAELVGQRGCPEFPDSLWIDVFPDRFIDLDKIYTGAYSLNLEYKHTKKVGDVEIVLNTGESGLSPTKIIRTHGEWIIDFSSLKDAVLSAYPHRARELDDYQRFIVGQFAALQDTALHARVINLDRAIRLRVARSNVYLLTSFDKFNDLVTQHILAPAAIAISRGSNFKKQRRVFDSSVPICHRWNFGQCDPGTCRYQHSCLACGRGHQERDCGEKQKQQSGEKSKQG
ncbi:hypothetical protein K439DRAFT_1370690, partial [Ramaria rubella]